MMAVRPRLQLAKTSYPALVISNGELFQVLKMMVGANLNDIQLQQIVDKTVLEADLVRSSLPFHALRMLSCPLMNRRSDAEQDKDGKISFDEFVKVRPSSDEILVVFTLSSDD